MAKPKIKSFQDACIKRGYDVVKVLPKVTGVPKQHRNAIIAHAKLVIITEALNEEWIPDWSNINQPKYYPWFDMSSGSGLSYGVCDDWFRVRVSAPAFALKAESWQSMQANNLLSCTKNTLY